ncbi:MAG: NgoBV family restriction endonuclease [Lachnospiraceae bacterium]|nr:NgoBV family restriction endonuclease [Lachnospiraceae bacterium]
MANKITAQELFTKLNNLHLEKKFGVISFNLAGISVKINTTDTVGITLQAWLKQYLIDNDIYFSEPANTQEFPDFFLDNNGTYRHMPEVKAFNYNATPAFDIANFESYCSSVQKKPYRLDADYLIFGYVMNNFGDYPFNRDNYV